jgi:WD40 repeat protein
VDGTKGAKLQGHSGGVNSLSFGPKHNLLASGGNDGAIRIWDVVSGEEVRATILEGRKVVEVRFSPDGKTVALATDDFQLQIWNLGDDSIRSFPAHKGEIHGLAFHPNGTLLASCSADETIKLWDPVSEQLIRTLTGHGHYAKGIAFSPDGSLLTSGYGLWDPDTGEFLESLPESDYFPHCVAFSPDGTKIAAGFGKSAQLWVRSE